MPVNNVFRWRDGAGWLVFSGGPTVEGRTRALSWARAEGGVAYIGLDVDDNEAVMDDMGELGAPTGYLVNVIAEDDDTIRARLLEAAIIVLPGHYEAQRLRSGLLGAAIEAMGEAHSQGSVILAEGNSAALLGAVILLADGTQLEGFKWVEDTLIVPGIASVSQSSQVRGILGARQIATAIGIDNEALIAFGPGGEVETSGHVTVALAAGMSPGNGSTQNS